MQISYNIRSVDSNIVGPYLVLLGYYIAKSIKFGRFNFVLLCYKKDY